MAFLHFPGGRKFEEYIINQNCAAGVILFGRKTYEAFIQFWPYQSGPEADTLNRLPKIVFSRTLKGPGTAAHPGAASAVRELAPTETRVPKGRSTAVAPTVRTASRVNSRPPNGDSRDRRVALSPSRPHSSRGPGSG
jgi:hypothetical protein